MILYSFIPHWTLDTTLLYTFMGIIGAWAIISPHYKTPQKLFGKISIIKFGS